ncbi:retrotransposon gag family protein, partial [Chitiniphilus shinanonensis]|uniref:retrotransposon gag family protein n=1 Tax=Chitiniphilus shinanonensis TaxID=553088 RepID=UPI0024E067F9
ANDVKGPIKLPDFEGDPPNFGSGVVSLIQQNCFNGLESENPHDHLNNYLQCVQTVKNFEANSEYISLALFPFSLRDKAKFWFNSLPKGSIGSWTELITVFLEKYFPVKRTAKMRAQITTFRQGYDESFDDAWERFNRLIQTCPHHNLSKLTVVDTFYDGLSQESRTMVDYSAGGTIVDKDPQEVLDLFERLAQQQQWSNRESIRGQKGRYEVDPLAMMQAKLEALQLRLDKTEGTSKMVQSQS